MAPRTMLAGASSGRHAAARGAACGDHQRLEKKEAPPFITHFRCLFFLLSAVLAGLQQAVCDPAASIAR
jgi:hypothetical protein